MGHSVDTLVSTYVGALTGDEDLANRRIAALLGGEEEWPRLTASTRAPVPRR
jgi:hypothetical protein